MKKNVVITGGSGLLALNWAQVSRDEFDVNLVCHNRKVKLQGTTAICFNLDSVNEIKAEFKKIKPEIVIHAAGLTNVEECESNPELAYHVNVELAANVSKACAELNIQLVHISTDHLFSGDEENVDEEHSVLPLNVYAKTKAQAEERVLASNSECLVIRTNFYGFGTTYRSSFSDLILNKLRNNENLTLFSDVFYTPIYTSVLVQAVHDLINNKVSGVFNVVGDERLSKYDFGLKIAKTFGLDYTSITKGKFSDQSKLIQRPYDMSLSNKKICDALGRKLGNVDEHVEILHQHYETGNAQEIQNI